MRIHGSLRCAALLTALTLLWGGGALASEVQATTPVGAAASARSTEEVGTAQPALSQPSLDQFALGYSRLTAQMRAGRALSSLLSVSPGYLPIADRGAANALRQMLSRSQFTFLQHEAGGESNQRLCLWSAGEPVLTLEHSAHGERRLWSSPELLPEGIETPQSVDLFAELLGQGALCTAVFAAPLQAGSSNIETALLQLVDAASDSQLMVSAEVVQQLREDWLRNPTYGALIRPLLSGWELKNPAALKRKLDDQGEWASIEMETRVNAPDGAEWELSCTVSRTAKRRQNERMLELTLTQNKSNTLRLTFSTVVTAPDKSRTKQAIKLICQGKLNGFNVDIRVNGAATNNFVHEGTSLVEQIDHDYTLYWKTRESVIAHLGLDEWKVTLKQHDVLRTEMVRDASVMPPASLESKVSLVMTRARKDFLSIDAQCSTHAEDFVGQQPAVAGQVWEQLGEAEHQQLQDLRGEAFRQIAGKLLKGLDAETLAGIWLP